MSQNERVREKVLLGSSDANIRFEEIRSLLTSMGFVERIRGSHHIFARDGVDEIINLQPKGSKAKPYQVKQVRNIMLKYKLETNDE
jgi:hypothetical protein